MAETGAAARARQISRQTDELVDACTVAMQPYTTAELHAIADDRAQIRDDCWITNMIREYLSVWRSGG